jgi:hypothetical protein
MPHVVTARGPVVPGEGVDYEATLCTRHKLDLE